MDDNDESLENSKQALRDIKNTLKAGSSEVAHEIRAATGDVREAGAEVADAARVAGDQVERHARTAAGSMKVSLKDATESAGVAAANFVDSQRESFDLWMKRAETYVREKPVTSISAAATAGLILGYLLRGSRE